MKIKEIKVNYSQSRSKNYNSARIEHGVTIELDSNDDAGEIRDLAFEALKAKVEEDLKQVNL